MRPSVSNANPHSREYSATVEKSQTDTNTHDIYGADVGGFPVKDCQQKEKIVKRPYDAMLLAKSESTEDLSLIRDPHRCQAWQRHIRKKQNLYSHGQA